MSQHDSSTDDQTTHEPEDVRTAFQETIEALANANDNDTAPFVALFTPRNRASILHVLLGATEPLTAREICDRAEIDRSTFGEHIEFLEIAGVVKDAGKKGNAQTYLPNRANPVTQLLTMAETVQRYGVTPDLLDGQFIGDPAESQ